jgi:glycosyltransferase involved in cell wall biosynthesis
MSANAPIPILFTHFGEDWIRGSEIILLDLLRSLDSELFHPIVWCNGQQMEQQSRAAGFETYRTDFHTMFDYGSARASPMRFWKLVKECQLLCQRHKVQILHANSAAPTQWMVPTAHLLQLPILTHLHIDYLRRSRYAFLLHASTVLVGVSKHVLLGPAADGVPGSRLRVIYNGINFERLGACSHTLRGRLGIPAASFVILSGGSLIDRKGFDILIRAFSMLPNIEPKPHLLIMGDGPKRADLEYLAARLNVAERVSFLGQVQNTADLYVEVDAFALASRGDSFGLVLAEAGYFGLPSVATKVGGSPEVLVDEETGLLADSDDVQGFCKQLERLMMDKALRAKLGAAARRRVQDKFSMERMAREFQQLYLTLAQIPKNRLGWISLGRAVSRPYTNLLLGSRGYSSKSQSVKVV